jgi:hypothetical protein
VSPVIVTTGSAVTPDQPPLWRAGRRLAAATVDTLAVVGSAGRLLARHWPVLLTLFLLGLAAREGALYAAVRASKVNGMLGFLVVVFAPMATLTALVLMLRTVRGSLPRLAPAGPDRLLERIGSVLIPFLAVYASYGYLKLDMSEYTYRVLEAEVFGNRDIWEHPERVNVVPRLPFSVVALLIAVVVAAVLLRWLLARWQAGGRRRWLGIPAAYVEVVWLTLVAATLTQVRGDVTGWIEDRRVVHGVQDTWTGLLDRFGALAPALHAATSWADGVLSSVDKVVVVPFAWLAVGAVVYGRSLAAPPTLAMPAPAVRRWDAVRGPVRRMAASLGADLRARFGPLVDGLRLLFHLGLAPMLLFCLAFLVARTAATWLWELERLIVGPQDLSTVWVPLSGLLGVLNDAVSMVLLACLLGAVVDRVSRTVTPAADPPASDPPAADPPATPPPG